MGSVNSKIDDSWRINTIPCGHYRCSTATEIWRNRIFLYGLTHSIVVVKYKCDYCREEFYRSYDFTVDGVRVSFGRPEKSKVIYDWKVHCTEGLTFSQIEKLSENVKTTVRFFFSAEKYDLLKYNCHDWALDFEKLLRSQNNCSGKCPGCKKYKLEYFPLKIQTWMISDTAKISLILYAQYGGNKHAKTILNLLEGIETIEGIKKL
uniref:Uncharacterized protein n=1 Tax=Meloidogyne enterolobii TaxID=390850 RepID=A0A6V7U918_MELEN|nr:unnamed protein product [Meloidogyne enterolobii]